MAPLDGPGSPLRTTSGSTEDRRAEHRHTLGSCREALHLLKLLLRAGEAGFQPRDLAEPALLLGLGEAGLEGGDALLQAGPLGGVRPQGRATLAGVLVVAGGAEVTG